MKAAGADVPVFEDGLAFYFDSEGMCSVVDDFEFMFFGDLLDGLHFAGNAIDVGCEDRGGSWGDGCFDLVGIDGQFVRKNIYKYRRAALPDDAGGGGHVGKGCGDDFTCEFQGLDGDLKCDGAVGDEEQVIESEVFFEGEFEFVDQRTVVSQPVSLPYSVEESLVFSAGREEGFGDGDQGDLGFRISDFGLVDGRQSMVHCHGWLD